MEMSSDDHRSPVKEWLGLDSGAPEDLPREARLAFGRIKLVPHGGVDSVGADEDIGFVEKLRSGFAIP
jgi:hypothetical protein